MTDYVLTREQARRFMLLKHGLIGDYKFIGKQGVLDFINQVGCIQFDPIDVCGKNSELVLQSRIKGFEKSMLYELLYKDRKLIDYFDKNLAIMNVTDWKYFSRYRLSSMSDGRSHDKVNAVCKEIKSIISAKGAVSSAEIGFNDKVEWYWSDTKLSRAALETMYFRGDLVVHHKKGTIKYYDLAPNCIPKEILNEIDPYNDDFEHMKWRVLRRISAVGILWNKASDAWLNIWGLKANERNEIFRQLLEEEKIISITVENVKNTLYCLKSDTVLIETALDNYNMKERCEFIAPLDNMLWDRKLIKELFNFDYKWEIYTPLAQRKYGHYVLPILYGDKFIGRIEIVNDKKSKCLIVKNIWFEDGVRQTKKLINDINNCINKFAKFNECIEIKKSEL